MRGTNREDDRLLQTLKAALTKRDEAKSALLRAAFRDESGDTLVALADAYRAARIELTAATEASTGVREFRL